MNELDFVSMTLGNHELYVSLGVDAFRDHLDHAGSLEHYHQNKMVFHHSYIEQANPYQIHQEQELRLSLM